MALLSVNMDDKLNKEFREFCDGIGINMSSTINMLVKQCVIQGKIPFEIQSKKETVNKENLMENFLVNLVNKASKELFTINHFVYDENNIAVSTSFTISPKNENKKINTYKKLIKLHTTISNIAYFIQSQNICASIYIINKFELKPDNIKILIDNTEENINKILKLNIDDILESTFDKIQKSNKRNEEIKNIINAELSHTNDLHENEKNKFMINELSGNQDFVMTIKELSEDQYHVTSNIPIPTPLIKENQQSKYINTQFILDYDINSNNFVNADDIIDTLNTLSIPLPAFIEIE